MPYRTILIAAALVAASPAVAQRTAEPPSQPPGVAAEPADDERIVSKGPREEVYVTGAARPLPVQRVEGARTFEQRQRDRAEGRCVLQAQEGADPMEPNFGAPETVCRGPG